MSHLIRLEVPLRVPLTGVREAAASRLSRQGRHAGGAQVTLSAHSPILAAMPGAEIYEVGPWGYRPCAWDDLNLVRNWRSFLDDPQRYFRHLP